MQFLWLFFYIYTKNLKLVICQLFPRASNWCFDTLSVIFTYTRSCSRG